MDVRPSILCPIDYSVASAGALRYAAAIAEHFVTRLIVLNVEDPLLTMAMDLGAGIPWTPTTAEDEIAQFASEVFEKDPETLALCECDVAIGKPSVEILRVARERSCDLIVMSSHGLSGARKLFFGSTTERVLRETTVPVLVTPPENPGPIHIEDAKRFIRRVVIPVDLSPASRRQTEVAAGLAEALDLPMVLVHVIEPVKSRLLSRMHVAGLDANRRSFAEEGLAELETIPRHVRPEALVVFGDPAEETAKIVRDRQAGLVVIGLHSSPMSAPRMGSVTYRLLCLSRSLVLALPPGSSKTAAAGTTASAAGAVIG